MFSYSHTIKYAIGLHYYQALCSTITVYYNTVVCVWTLIRDIVICVSSMQLVFLSKLQTHNNIVQLFGTGASKTGKQVTDR